MKAIFQACDGSLHPTAEECRAHDEATPEHVLANRTATEILAGINRQDLEIADALERVGTKIARDRRADGEFKRARNAENTKPLALEGPREEPAPERPSDTEQPENEAA